MADSAALAPDVLLEVSGLTKLFPPRRTLFQRKAGNPVRAEFTQIAPYIPPRAGETFRILVLGGSQGASVFSKLLPEAVALVADKARLDIVQHHLEPGEIPGVGVEQAIGATGGGADIAMAVEDDKGVVVLQRAPRTRRRPDHRNVERRFRGLLDRTKLT